jgi:hypothetical protein
MATKTGYLSDSIAKSTGYYSAKGEKLKGAALTQAEQDAWNGVAKKAESTTYVMDASITNTSYSAEHIVPEAEEKVEHIKHKKTKKKKGFFSKGS